MLLCGGGQQFTCSDETPIPEQFGIGRARRSQKIAKISRRNSAQACDTSERQVALRELLFNRILYRGQVPICHSSRVRVTYVARREIADAAKQTLEHQIQGLICRFTTVLAKGTKKSFKLAPLWRSDPQRTGEPCSPGKVRQYEMLRNGNKGAPKTTFVSGQCATEEGFVHVNDGALASIDHIRVASLRDFQPTAENKVQQPMRHPVRADVMPRSTERNRCGVVLGIAERAYVRRPSGRKQANRSGGSTHGQGPAGEHRTFQAVLRFARAKARIPVQRSQVPPDDS